MKNTASSWLWRLIEGTQHTEDTVMADPAGAANQDDSEAQHTPTEMPEDEELGPPSEEEVAPSAPAHVSPISVCTEDPQAQLKVSGVKDSEFNLIMK